MKKIGILGSTGSIGTQALEIIEDNKEEYSVSVLSCGRNVELLSRQINKFSPEIVVTELEKDAIILKKKHPKVEVLFGMEGLITAATQDNQLILNSLVGMMGLLPTYKGIMHGNNIALANKETLVAGGKLIMDAVLDKGIKLLPVDSEHSAIFQCLQGNDLNSIKSITLTASGGPFRNYTLKQLESVTLEKALKHPKWTMGKKITIDSATMMNKGLEVIEAYWLFGLPQEKINIAVHPQSIIHSMVEYIDNSFIAQMGLPDMKIPISYAFSYPNRIKSKDKSLDIFNEGGNLTFEKVDTSVFKCISLAYEALKKGGSYSILLNGANEVLVGLFLEGKINFIDIQNMLELLLDNHNSINNLDVETIIEIDRESREAALRMAAKIKGEKYI